LAQVNQEVLLRILAEVADALKGLNQVRDGVRALASETKAESPLKLDLQIGEGLARLRELRTGIEETVRVTKGDGGKINLKLDVGAIDKELKDLASRVKTGVTEIRNSFEGLGKVKVDLGLARKGSKEFQEFQAELRKLESQFQGAVNRLNTASRGVTFDPISRSATLARDKVRIAAENMADFLGKIPAAVTKDEAAFAGLQAKIESLRAAAARLSQIDVVPPGGVPAAASLTSSIGSLESAFGLASKAAQLFLASLVVQKLLDFGKSAVQVASDLQILQGQLEIFVGGPQEAADAIDHLRDVADDVGISFITLTDNFQKFLVPAQAAGLSLKETQQVFDAISIAVAGAGKSTEEVNGIFKTFTDVLQKGVIQAEELVKQFANNGIPATALLARAYGKTTAEVRELTKEHQILARDGVPALAAEMLKVYGPAALKNVESFRSENERFKNEIIDLKQAFGDELLPALVEVLQTLKGFDGEGTFASLGSDVATVIRLLGDVARIFRDLKNFDLKSAFVGIDVLFLNLAATGVKSFGALEESAAKLTEALGLAPKGFADAVAKSVDEAVEKLRFAAKEARKLGEESRAGAEEGGEGVRNLGEEWKKLYENLKKQQAAHQKNAEDSEKELTKKQLAEIKKREDAYKSFFQKLAELSKTPDPNAPDLAGSVPSSVKAPDVQPGDSTSLAKLREELAATLQAKRELELQPSVSTEDLAQIDSLRGKVQDLETQIRSYGSASGAAGDQAAAGLQKTQQAAAEAAAKVQAELGTKTLDALRQLITGTDDFAKAFTDLSPKAQNAVTGIVAAFEQAAQSGNISRDQIAEFGQLLIKAFQDGGLVGKQFAADLAAAFGTTGTAAGSLTAALRALADGSKTAGAGLKEVGGGATATAASLKGLTGEANVSAAGLKGVGSEAGASVPSLTGAGQAAETAATAVRHAGESAKEFDDRIRSLIDTSGGTATAVRGVGEAANDAAIQVNGAAQAAASASQNFIGVRDAAGNLGPNLLKTGEDAKTAKSEIDGVAVAAAKAADNFIGVRDAAGNVGPNLLDVSKSAGEAKKGVDDLSKAEPPTKLNEGLTTTADAAQKVVDPIKSIAESTAKLGDATQVEGAAKLGEALTGLTAPAAALAPPLELVAGAASRLSQAVQALLAEPGLGTIESQLTPLLVPLQNLTEPVTTLSEALAKLGQATQTVKADGLTALGEAGAKLSSLAEPASSAAKALGPLTEASTLLGTTFATVNTNASSFSTTLAAIGEATTALVASLSDAALTTGLDGLTESFAGAGPDLASVATELDRFAKALDASKVALPEVQAGIEAIAESVGKPEVKDGLNSLAGSIDKIASSATGAGEGLVVVGESLAAISGSAEKAADGLASIAKSLHADEVRKGAAAIKELGESGASAATGAKNLADSAKDAKVEIELLTAVLDEATRAEISIGEAAARAAPIIQGDLKVAFRQLNEPLEVSKESFEAIVGVITYLGRDALGIIQVVTEQVNGLATAWQKVASAAAAAKQAITGIRLPPAVGQSGGG